MTHPDDRLGVRRVILKVEFNLPQNVVFRYRTVPDDYRETGLAAVHELIVPMTTRDYYDELVEAYEAIERFLNDALDDMALLPPIDPAAAQQEQDDDDDDDD